MAMQTLHGSCACGRNRYVIEIPPGRVQQAELRYDNTSASRLLSANPVAFFLRVPLSWYTSATFAQRPDETRLSIQRSFALPFAPYTCRKFCGYCGTQLSSWTERTRDDADHISLTVGSLLDDDQALLAELGLLPGSQDETALARLVAEPRGAGAPWFEELVQNTRLGHWKQQRGAHTDKGVHVEWEVVEWTEDDDGNQAGHTTAGKRKISEVEAGENAEMAP